MKKNSLIIIICFWFTSCNSQKMIVNKRFTYINTDKEFDIELVLKEDFTFTLIDKYGCNQFSQKGKWIYLKENKIILTDTTKVVKSRYANTIRYSFVSNFDGLKYTIRESQFFPLISKDTLEIINSRKIKFRGNIFEEYYGDLEEKRILQLENFYIKRAGKEAYIKAIGDGISIERARENLSECTIGAGVYSTKKGRDSIRKLK